MDNKRLSVIGAVPHPDVLKSYGGTTTLMQNFIDYCRAHGYAIRHIETLRYKNKVVNFFCFAAKFLYGVITCRCVMYNVCSNGAFTLFYYTAPLAYALRRKVIFRKFGGFFIQQLQQCPVGKRVKMVGLLNKASLLLFETKTLVNEGEALFRHPERIVWFPNCRKPSPIQRAAPGYRKRFVFISHMRVDKGVDILMQAAAGLPEDYTVDLYGPIYTEKYNDPAYFDNTRVTYRGALRTEEVLPTLAQYDVLVLPTYWATEGYPGIIIEAMSLGIPAIATPQGGIPEMITDGENGLLVPLKDAEALRRAMLSVTEESYRSMSAIAKRRFDEEYNSDAVNERIWQTIQSL